MHSRPITIWPHNGRLIRAWYKNREGLDKYLVHTLLLLISVGYVESISTPNNLPPQKLQPHCHHYHHQKAILTITDPRCPMFR